MNKSWQHCKNILIVRADNMGDLIMSAPAIRALKETFGARITLLTSSMAAGITAYLTEIDDVFVCDLPWVKAQATIGANEVFDVIQRLKEYQFDAAVIFTVFSQNPLPAAMIAYLAGIPLRLAYCRENPYELLTDWVPDPEPYRFIRHQVERDLELVASIGATATDKKLQLEVPASGWGAAKAKLEAQGIDINKPWIIFHAGVSEPKREYPATLWVETAKKFTAKGYQVLFTGAKSESYNCEQLAANAGQGTCSVAGLLSLAEFIATVQQVHIIVSVNTGTTHIAAAVGTPVVVLYAQTNPQHTPWMVPYKSLEFSVPENARSGNEVVQFLYSGQYKEMVPYPTPDAIFKAVQELLNH